MKLEIACLVFDAEPRIFRTKHRAKFYSVRSKFVAGWRHTPCNPNRPIGPTIYIMVEEVMPILLQRVRNEKMASRELADGW